MLAVAGLRGFVLVRLRDALRGHGGILALHRNARSLVATYAVAPVASGGSTAIAFSTGRGCRIVVVDFCF